MDKEALGQWHKHLKALSDVDYKDPNNTIVRPGAIPKELYMGWDTLHKAKKEAQMPSALEKLKNEDYTCYCVVYNDRYGNYPDGAREKMDFDTKTLYENALNDFKVTELKKLDWKELTQKGFTSLLKTLDRNGYNEKYKAYYGVYPTF